MQLSEQWLRTWVNPEVSTAVLADQLSMAGLEVDGMTAVAAEFSQVIVAEITHCEQHPDADRLRVCQVNTGTETVQIVCGAPNARVGIKVALAQIGAVLPPLAEDKPFKIKKSKLRGVESEGMLCSARELELADEHEGIIELAIDAPVGMDLREYLSLNDVSIDVDLTPNRGDCLSIAGIAREVSVLNRTALTPVHVELIAPVHDERIDIELNAGEDCPRYIGRIIKEVNVHTKAPLWLTERLRRSGIRSISLPVDVTNYVMLELGQPMHAFDLNTVKGGIEVRRACPGETLVLLDGTEISLTPDVLVIADDAKPLAMAGIMGGESSGVSDDTQDLFLESAFFAPTAIAGRARRYGLHTDSSHRFERGVDPELARVAIERATQLIIDIASGKPGPCLEAEKPEYLPTPVKLILRQPRIAKILGVSIADDEVEDILVHLGMTVERIAGGWQVSVPSFRFDMEREEDLIEEIARIHGYDHIPLHAPKRPATVPVNSEQKLTVAQLSQVLVNRGYSEAMNYSFLDEKLQTLVCPKDEFLRLANPLSEELAIMRTSLLPGLLKSLLHNQKRQQERVRLFEVGTCFRLVEGKKQERQRIAGVIAGAVLPLHWSGETAADFYDLKGDVEALLALTQAETMFKSAEHSALHPGQSAQVKVNGRCAGVIGALHPHLAQKLNVKGKAFLFELDLQAISSATLPKAKSLSRYPSIKRDLALLVDEAISAADLTTAVSDVVPEQLQDVRIFDIYQGEGIQEGKKSVALSLILQDLSRTLTEEDVAALIEKVKNTLMTTFGAVLRE
ncbi:phenylalanine--tRNA ligase subunit beta [Piscirickettsia salmonis]|uniref:phenylalanine--tRNA ligase subunit beta n=1 Tax=Piscirickettsia salmonis TaxID=1238 RepID=UPI000313A925|nr:phenylalanine--tRNA ligase subunit beta [Piscirickettsia salmonis]PEQ17747.1 phenylalanine--tRNA ligase subunit beta [Piscirickettsia salmonis]QGN76312.1 Phenylalanine--tRNA ligase beta subunit [Piscirickettsia salmonis]QGN79875.1 Phenylalanine--tRNA ligase beta subunit [Piscirickettsia salmonis]QGN83463.1 Phenylalanine--tRNA ligase beta subunit [Piscirickettsia salmonis]QGN86976.1 Phenylalanine--tRNA ligase beta subunit [Piscirickettsia salmonis]